MTDKITLLAEHFVSHMPTWIFVFMAAFFAYYVVKLHVSAQHKAFDLARLFTHPDGTLDREGFIIAIVFAVTTYAFFHLMYKNPDIFASAYAWYYAGFWLAYCGFRMKTRLPAPIAELVGKGEDLAPKDTP
jgi:hypothetical protein